MAIDPGTAYLVSQGLSAVGGLFSDKKGMSDKDRAEAQRQFDESQRLAQELGRTNQTMAQVEQIGGINRQMEMLPLRDKVAYMLRQRAGQVPQKFQGNDMFNPGGPAPQQGGVDTAALTAAAGAYQPGAGGTDRRVYDAMMAKLGLTNGEGGPSIGRVDIQDPHVQWGRAPNTRMNAEYEAQQRAERLGVPYQPPSAGQQFPYTGGVDPNAPPPVPTGPPQMGGGSGGYAGGSGTPITQTPGGGAPSPWSNVNPGIVEGEFDRRSRPSVNVGRRF